MAATHFHSTLPLVDDPDGTGVVSEALDTASLSTLGSGQGARVTTRENASDAAERARGAAEKRHAENVRLSGTNRPSYARHEQKKVSISRPQIIILAVAALVVTGVLIFVFSKCAGSVAENPDALSWITTSESLEAEPGLSVTYDGVTYAFSETGSAWQLVATSSEGERTVALDGTPIYLVIYNDTIFVPENLADGTWDVVAYRLAEGAVAAKVPDASGEGVLTKADLNGDALDLTLESGEMLSITLQ